MRCHIHKKAAAAAVVCLCVSMPACVCGGVLSWDVGYWWRWWFGGYGPAPRRLSLRGRGRESDVDEPQEDEEAHRSILVPLGPTEPGGG